MTTKTYSVKSTGELLLETTPFEAIQFLEREVIDCKTKIESEKGFRHEAFLRHLKAHNSMQRGCFLGGGGFS